MGGSCHRVQRAIPEIAYPSGCRMRLSACWKGDRAQRQREKSHAPRRSIMLDYSHPKRKATPTAAMPPPHARTTMVHFGHLVNSPMAMPAR